MADSRVNNCARMSRPADPNARAELIAAARKEFWRHGIHKARIEDITTSSGLSKGSFYLHFESKEALFRELVVQLTTGMDTLLSDRMRLEREFFEKSGPVKKRELEEGSARLGDFEEHNRRCDRAVFELLWAERDVAYVLLNGAQNTEFDGLIWALLDQQGRRIIESFEQLQKWGFCRRDIPLETVASMLIGAWLVLLRRMTVVREKPDFDSWLLGLNELLGRGINARAAETQHKKPSSRKHSTRSMP